MKLARLLDARSKYKINLYTSNKLENEIYKNNTIYNRIQKKKNQTSLVRPFDRKL